MKIIFVVPPSNIVTVVPPIGVGYIASLSRQKGHDVSIIDARSEPLSVEQAAERISVEKPDLLGVSVLTANYLAARSIVRRVKERIPRTKIVLGGPHASALPQEVLGDTAADFVIRGEGEHALLRLADILQKGNGDLSSVDNLCYRKNGGIILNPHIERIEELDSLPFPAWDLIPPRRYPPAPHLFLFKNYPIAPVITSRGCPFSCHFCASGQLMGHKLRVRSAANVANEIELLVKKYGVREIHFEDDNFTLLRDHAVRVCEEIIRRGIKISWQNANGVRADALDDELLGLMKRSGCYRLLFGIESGVQELLSRIEKGLDLRSIASRIRMVKKAGIEVSGAFIFGLPGETEGTLRRTIEFINTLDLDLLGISLLVPLPGSRIFDERRKALGYGGMDWNAFNYFTASDSKWLPGVSLRKFQKLALRRFYFRPRTMAYIAKRLKLRQLGHACKMALCYLG